MSSLMNTLKAQPRTGTPHSNHIPVRSSHILYQSGMVGQEALKALEGSKPVSPSFPSFSRGGPSTDNHIYHHMQPPYNQIALSPVNQPIMEAYDRPTTGRKPKRPTTAGCESADEILSICQSCYRVVICQRHNDMSGSYLS